MAADQQAEVLLAQRLASNEKPVRTRAMKKLRKYVSVRSQQAVFSGEELLKLWKGLFYCLWMQDKPLLQEELSRQISTLIHGFHTTEQQLSYLQSFLQTMKREWTGIDQLRMDKFFQLVRFMFRQALEALRRRSWDSSVVSQFLELLSAQLLQSDGAAPSGLQLHVLDLYLTELAAVGAAELTADQNLTFIEPFCRTAARTKDRTLFSSICSSIFSTIIDQAPFAIEDLMKEVKAAEDSDSGQASDEEEPGEEDTRKMEGGKKQVNGTKKSDQEEEEEEDEEFLHLENLDSDSPYDEDVGPVLQFDYSALADKLLEFSSQSGTPGPNRQRLYKIVKILRDLSEGVFPQDEYPEEVSTDEDDDMFGSRKRMKRRRHAEEGEEAGPVVKKGKKKEDAAADVSAENKKKKKKKKKKKREEQPEQTQTQTAEEAAAPVLKATDHEDQHEKKKEAPPTSQPAGAPTSEKSSGIMGTCEVLGKEMTAASPAESDAKTPAKKRKKKKADGSAEQTQTAEEAAGTIKVTETALGSEATTQPDRHDQPKKKKHKNTDTPPTAEPDLSEKKKKKKKKKGAAADTGSCEAEETRGPPESEAATPAKKKEKKKKAATEGEAPLSAGMDGTPATGSDATTPAKKKKSITADKEQAAEVPQLAKKKTKKKGTQEATTDPTPAETPQKKKKDQRDAPEEEEGRQEANAGMTPAKKKKKRRKQEAGEVVDSNAEAAVKKKKRKIPVVFEFEADELQAANGLAEEEETAAKKPRRTNVEAATLQRKKQGGGGSPSAFITFQSKAKAPTPLFWKVKGSPSMPASVRKKFQTPKSDSKKVTFGLKNNKTAEFRKSDRSLLVSPDGSSRVPFDPQQKPKFGVLKSPPTPLSVTVKRTPIRRKKGGASPQTTPTRRAVASDFF